MKDLVRTLANDALDYNRRALLEWSRSTLRGDRRATPDPKGGFYVERGLIDGVHNVRVPGERDYGPWLNEHQWDFLVYMNSCAKRNGRMWPKANAAQRKVGLPRSYRSRTSLHYPMIRRGFLADDEPTSNGMPTWKLLLLPQRTVAGYVRSTEARTLDNLERSHRPYFWMPNSLMTGVGPPWKTMVTHRKRRLLTALYAFNQLQRHGGVDPNHLRLEVDSDCRVQLVTSVEFEASAACGAYLPNLLDQLHQDRLLGIVPVRTRRGGPPSGPDSLCYLEDDGPDGDTWVIRPRWQEPTQYEAWRDRFLAT